MHQCFKFFSKVWVHLWLPNFLATQWSVCSVGRPWQTFTSSLLYFILASKRCISFSKQTLFAVCLPLLVCFVSVRHPFFLREKSVLQRQKSIERIIYVYKICLFWQRVFPETFLVNLRCSIKLINFFTFMWCNQSHSFWRSTWDCNSSRQRTEFINGCLEKYCFKRLMVAWIVNKILA